MPGPNGKQVNCCGPAWEAIFQSRVGQMMDNYLQGGVERIYWLTVPTQRDPARKPIADDVNQAIRAEAAPARCRVRVDRPDPDLHPRRHLPRLDLDRRQADDRPPVRRHPPERGRLIGGGGPGASGPRSRFRLLGRPLDHWGSRDRLHPGPCAADHGRAVSSAYVLGLTVGRCGEIGMDPGLHSTGTPSWPPIAAELHRVDISCTVMSRRHQRHRRSAAERQSGVEFSHSLIRDGAGGACRRHSRYPMGATLASYEPEGIRVTLSCRLTRGAPALGRSACSGSSRAWTRSRPCGTWRWRCTARSARRSACRPCT